MSWRPLSFWVEMDTKEVGGDMNDCIILKSMLDCTLYPDSEVHGKDPGEQILRDIPFYISTCWRFYRVLNGSIIGSWTL